jgi:signal peptidase II
MALYFVFAGLIAALDRLFKLWAAKTLAQGQVFKLIPGILRLTYVENTGAAFSMLSNMRWLLVAVSGAAAVALVFVILTYKNGGVRLSAAAILGGAVGNLIDRIATGRVIDMFEPEFIDFAVFNIADTFIVLGGIALVILVLISATPDGKARRLRNAAADKAPVIPEAPASEDGGELTEQSILEEYYRDLEMERGGDDGGDGNNGA